MGKASWKTHGQHGILYGINGKAGVIVTPGASFGPHGEGYVRFALVLPPEKIKEAVESIRTSGI